MPPEDKNLVLALVDLIDSFGALRRKRDAFIHATRELFAAVREWTWPSSTSRNSAAKRSWRRWRLLTTFASASGCRRLQLTWGRRRHLRVRRLATR